MDELGGGAAFMLGFCYGGVPGEVRLGFGFMVG